LSADPPPNPVDQKPTAIERSATRPSSNPGPRAGISPRAALGIALFGLAWAGVLAFNLVPQLRGDYGWRWPYEVPLQPFRLLPLVAGLAVYVLGARHLVRRRRAAWLLVWVIAASASLPIASIYVSASPFVKIQGITTGGVAGGWHYASIEITDLGTTLRDWPRFMERSTRFSSHMGISPPGIVVIYYAADRLLEHFPLLARSLARPLRAVQCHNMRLMGYSNGELASAWLGMAMPLWAALTVLPMFFLGQRLFGERAARWGAIWWPLVPSLLMFAPSPYTFFPFLAVSAVALFTEGLYRQRVGWALASGVLLSLSSFLTFAFLPLFFLAGLFALGVCFLGAQRPPEGPTRPFPWSRLLCLGLAFTLGMASVWVIYHIFTGVPVWAVLRASMGRHVRLSRPYLPWLILHPYDYVIFTGWPLAILAGVAVGRAFRKLRVRAPLFGGEVLALATATTLAALDLSGIMRGESGRILLFFTPLLLLVAGSALRGDGPPERDTAGWLITISQVVVLVIMVAFLRVIDSEFSRLPPVSPPRLAVASPMPELPSGALFDGALRLQGFSGAVRKGSEAGPVLDLWLRWESVGQVDRAYYLSLIPVAPNGRVADRAFLVQPFSALYPTTCWLPRSGPIHEHIEVPLFAGGGDGAWWLSLALIDGRSGVKVAVVLPDGSRDDQTGLGPLLSR